MFANVAFGRRIFSIEKQKFSTKKANYIPEKLPCQISNSFDMPDDKILASFQIPNRANKMFEVELGAAFVFQTTKYNVWVII